MGKDDRCLGVYLKYLERGETPPRPTEIAKIVGCDPSTASRAIKKWEDKRLELAEKNARDRQTLHNSDDALHNGNEN
jgi:DNA-binding MarR family transcriptional regulator